MELWQEVRDGVYVAKLQPASVNVGLIVGQDGVVLIDAGSSPAQGREIAESAAELAGVSITHVVITHDHWDHLFGLAGVLDAAPNAVAIGHEAITLPDPSDADFRRKVASDLGFDVAEVVQPSEQIAIVKALNVGNGRRVEIFHPGGGHTHADLAVLVPDAGVVFVGDLIEQGADPAFGPDTVIRNWPTAIDAVMTSAGHLPDIVYVPGHGAPVDANFVAEQRIAIATVWGLGDELVRVGTTLDQALSQLDAGTHEWPFSTDSMRGILPLLYAELADAGVTKSRLLPLL